MFLKLRFLHTTACFSKKLARNFSTVPKKFNIKNKHPFQSGSAMVHPILSRERELRDLQSGFQGSKLEITTPGPDLAKQPFSIADQFGRSVFFSELRGCATTAQVFRLAASSSLEFLPNDSYAFLARLQSLDLNRRSGFGWKDFNEKVIKSAKLCSRLQLIAIVRLSIKLKLMAVFEACVKASVGGKMSLNAEDTLTLFMGNASLCPRNVKVTTAIVNHHLASVESWLNYASVPWEERMHRVQRVSKTIFQLAKLRYIDVDQMNSKKESVILNNNDAEDDNDESGDDSGDSDEENAISDGEVDVLSLGMLTPNDLLKYDFPHQVKTLAKHLETHLIHAPSGTLDNTRMIHTMWSLLHILGENDIHPKFIKKVQQPLIKEIDFLSPELLIIAHRCFAALNQTPTCQAINRQLQVLDSRGVDVTQNLNSTAKKTSVLASTGKISTMTFETKFKQQAEAEYVERRTKREMKKLKKHGHDRNQLPPELQSLFFSSSPELK